MKIRQICMLVLLCLGVIPAVQAQTYDKLWKQVEQAEKKSLPETVIKLTGEIYQKGEKEKNSPQMLKAYMWRMRYRDMLTPDSLYTNLNGLELWAKQTDQPMDRAVLHSLIAEIYSMYAFNNQWQLRQRTEIVGEAPSADMREWTANMFVEKVRTNVKEAMADSVLLLNTSSRTYIPFVELGETSEYYHHDMYHLLATRGIVALQQVAGLDRATPVEDISEDSSAEKESSVKQDIIAIYGNMIAAYKASGLKEGYVLTALSYLEWRRDSDRNIRPFGLKKGLSGLTEDTYVTALNELKSRFKSESICAEVYLAQARYAIEKEQQTSALQLCDEAIRLYPGYRRINALKNLREDILSPFLNVTAAATAFPGEEIEIRASHKNLDGFTLRLYQAKKLIKEQHFAVLRPEDYRTQDTVFTFKAPEVGQYVMRIVPDIRAKRDSESKFNVTRFKVLTCRLPGNQYEVVTLDGQTGHPIPNAKITLYTNDEKVLQEYITGADGKVVFPWKSEYRYLKAAKGIDTDMPFQSIYGGSYGYYGDENKVSEGMTLLTDRSLYRPGQIVYVKGIAYVQKSDTANVLPNKDYTVVLMDANNQEVGQKAVRTNEFGSFTVDFALPSACLNGMFSLKAGEGRTNIRVEDYKRPTFDITFDKQQGSYQLGDKVEVKGKIQSYSGVLLQDLPVKYTVKRSVVDLWRLAESTQIASGEVIANEDGEFTIPVLLEENNAYKNNTRIYYRYSIEATATNVAGETQSSTDVIAAGNRSLILQTELKEKTCKNQPFNTVFKVQNLNGQPVEVKGTFSLYQAKDADFKQLDENPAATGTFTSNEEMTIEWGNLPSGPYVLKAVVKDGQGKEVTAEANTILFSREDNRPPVETTVWFYEANTEFDATHPAVFCFGTSKKDAYVMMNVFSGDKLLESKTLNLSDTIVRFEYPYRESYGDGVFVNLCMVRDGQVYQEQVRLTKRIPDKTLTMKWEVFRDKLRPGQKEEWKLTIKTPQGQAANAEMLATMYDASLDKIWNRQQNFQIYYNQIVPYSNWMSGYSGNNSFNYWWNTKSLKVPSLEYDHFVMLSDYYNNGRDLGEVIVRGYGSTRKLTVTGSVSTLDVATLRSNAPKMKSAMAADAMTNVEFQSEMIPTGEKADEASDNEMLPEASADLRTNLAETAFFYPQLRTNEQGEILISDLEPGVYSIRETATLGDHLLDPTEHHVELFPGQTSTIVLENDRRPSLTIHKNDADTGEPVEGVVFTAKAADGSTVTEVKTGSDGTATLEHLLPIVYEVTEKYVPEPYLLDAPSQLITLYPNKDSDLYFVNHKKPSLTIEKIDSITGNPIKGAKFQIWYASNSTETGELNDLGTYFTDENGQIFLENVKDGWYKVTELEPASGYQIKEPATQECFIEAGASKTLTFENIWKL